MDFCCSGMARADATATAQKTPGHVVCNDDGLDEKDALAPAASEVGAQQAVAVHSMLERAGCNTNWLSLIGASLTAVPAKINPSSFPFLTQLYLGHNRIKALPDALFSLFSLRGLFLQNNHIARLSPKINHLTELQELYLSSNLLSCVPPLGSLALLDCLWLDDNPHLPVMLTRNISRNKESVQHLIHQIGDYYGHRSGNCRRSVLFFLCGVAGGISVEGQCPLTVLPAEMAQLIARKVWHSRYDNDWQW